MDFALDVDESRIHSTVLVAQGDLDAYSAPRLRDCLLDLVNQGRCKIVLDLDRVDFIDSAGLGVIVGGVKRLRGLDGDLTLVVGQPNILRLLDMTGLRSIFRITATLDEAIVQ